MHPFDQDIAGQAMETPLVRQTRVSSNWSINGLPNGGYLLALMANGMLQCGTKSTLAIVTANYVARCLPDAPATLHLERFADAAQFERIQARLVQEGRERIRAWGTLVDPHPGCPLDRCEADPPVVADLDQCIPIPRMPRFTLFDQVEVRLDPACAGWMSGRQADRSEHKGWFRFQQARPFDAFAVLLAADAFPPPVYATQGLGAWVPTIELTVNVRKPPASQWLKCIFRTRFITCGLLEEDGEVWDETGALVAISRQIAQYRMR